MIIGLIYLGWIYGLKQVALLYFGPYIVTFAWLVIITWLQHTEPSVPHYGDDEWTWLKGAVLTIDRNYPWIIDHLHHRIGTTHVLHHIFPEIPHYHAI
jgi:omega-6 fatty acid desaturase (delta-12 desaturase)